MYKCLFFIPSFLYYTVMVFIPRLIFEFVPYFVLTVIPNFVLVTLPNLFWNAVYNFWEIVHFFASISIVNVWNTLLTTPSTLFYVTKNLAKAAGGFLLNAAGNLVLGGYSLTSNYLMLFYSYFCTHTFDLLSRLYFYVWYFFDIFYHAWQYILGIF